MVVVVTGKWANRAEEGSLLLSHYFSGPPQMPSLFLITQPLLSCFLTPREQPGSSQKGPTYPLTHARMCAKKPRMNRPFTLAPWEITYYYIIMHRAKFTQNFKIKHENLLVQVYASLWLQILRREKKFRSPTAAMNWALSLSKTL